MGGKVLVPLLVTIVLLDVVQVIAAKNHGALHLVGHNNAAQNAATDGNLALKRERVSKRQVRACEDGSAGGGRKRMQHGPDMERSHFQ